MADIFFSEIVRFIFRICPFCVGKFLRRAAEKIFQKGWTISKNAVTMKKNQQKRQKGLEKKILLCDDNQYELKGLEKLIRRHFSDCEVVMFSDSQRALDYMKQNVVAILLTDIKMPLLSGLDLAILAKNVQPGLEVILLSAYPEFKFAQRAIKIGVREYLTKPVEEDQLVELLTHLMGEEEQNGFSVSLQSREILETFAQGKNIDANTFTGNTLKCIHFIEEHYSDPELGLDMLATNLFLSVSYLCSIFKNDCGVSIVRFLNQFRMNRAKELLTETNLPVKAIMEKVGYSNFSYFSNAFYKMFHFYPSEIREQRE